MMLGEYVNVDLGNGVEIKVWIWCSPDTPILEKQKRALVKAMHVIEAKLDTKEMLNVNAVDEFGKYR